MRHITEMTMRMAMIHGVRDVRIHEVAVPTLQPGEVLVRILAVGLCGSDLHYYLEGGIGSQRIEGSMTTGHELAGEVANGSGEEFGFEDGTLVAIDPAQPCGDCEQCLQGYTNLCPNIRFLGTPMVAGGLCDYLAVSAKNLVRLPEGFDAIRGALLEPLGVALHACDIARIKPMSEVAVVGAGPIGLLIVQVARAVGAGRIRVIEPHDGRSQAARLLDVDSVHSHWEDALCATNGRGADFVFEATNSPEGPDHACEIAKIGGHITLVGIPEGDKFSLSSSTGRRKALTIRFSRRMGNVYPRAIDMVEQGRVNLDCLVSHRYPLEQAAEAFAVAARLDVDFVKGVICPADSDS